MLTHLIEEIIIWVESIGYWGAFLAGTGFVPPKVTLLVLGSIKNNELVVISLLVALGAVVASTISYLIGFYFRNKDILKFLNGKGKFLHISEKSYNSTRNHVKKEGVLYIFFSRFIGGLRMATSLIAGYLKYNFLLFILSVFFGTFTYSYIFAYIGSHVGFNWSQIKKVIDTFNTVIIIILLFIFLLYVYIKKDKFFGKKK